MSVELSGLRLPLAHFTLEVDAVLSGRVTAIFGASGSGKTSLLEIIAGLRRPAAGIVRIDGVALTDVAAGTLARPERRAVGYVPQEGALFPHLNVRQNLRFGFDESRPRPAGLTFEHVAEVLEAQYDNDVENAITFVSIYYEGRCIAKAFDEGYRFSIHQSIRLAMQILDARRPNGRNGSMRINPPSG